MYAILSDPGSGKGSFVVYQARQKLDVPADVAWTILTSQAGARLWLGDDGHPGLRPGASFPMRRGRAAEIADMSDGKSVSLEFPDGRTASVAICPTGDKCELVIDDNGGADKAESWKALLTAGRFIVDQTKARRRGKQAIVVIHGIGNQRPLSMVKGITGALTKRSDRWSKPDQLSSSYELRRYQLKRRAERPRTDFFELYWADKVPATKLNHVTSWLRTIALRRPSHLGRSLRPIAYLTWTVVALAILAAVAAIIVLGTDGAQRLYRSASSLADVAWISATLSLVGAVINGFLLSSLGDAARYLDASPDNISVRQSIRASGVSLLERLHTEGRYDRIVVVGHSLGSVVGYDIIRHYWAQVHRTHGSPLKIDQSALKAYQVVLTASHLDEQQHRAAQRALWREYRRLGHEWLVTDLVTIGSPLTHAATLLARSPANLSDLIEDLELPTCPPTEGAKSFERLERYLVDGQIRAVRIPTHAAVFAVTRWTNLYVPTRALVFGDPIGGPVAPVFGPGVKDVPVRPSSWWRRTVLAHTSYWQGKLTDPSLRRLADAIDIESGRWFDDHIASMPWTVGRDYD